MSGPVLTDDESTSEALKPGSRLRLINASCDIRDNQAPPDLFYNHSVLAQTALPYRNPGDAVRHWTRTNGNASLRLEAGSALDKHGQWQDVGLPFGPRSRLVLIHISTQAVLNRSPEIQVEDSMTAFAAELGLGISGRNIRTLRDQLSRLSGTTMRLAMRHPERRHRSGAVVREAWSEQVQSTIFSRFEVWYPKHPRQRTLWPSVVTLSPAFYESLVEHAVPLDKRALAALKHSSRCLDIYQWLAHRLRRARVDGTTQVSWRQLRAQFGEPTQNMGSFKRKFGTALDQVKLVYPKAKVEKDPKNGLILKKSPPPSTGHRRLTRRDP